jgi:hypothetical protein
MPPLWRERRQRGCTPLCKRGICLPDLNPGSNVCVPNPTFLEVICDDGDGLEIVGLLGSSGKSSAPHLHFHVRVLDLESGEHVYADPYSDDPGASLWVEQSGGLGRITEPGMSVSASAARPHRGRDRTPTRITARRRAPGAT